MGYVQGSDNGRRNKQSTTSGLHNTHEGGVLHEVGLDQSGYESSHGTEYHVRSIPGARGRALIPLHEVTVTDWVRLLVVQVSKQGGTRDTARYALRNVKLTKVEAWMSAST